MKHAQLCRSSEDVSHVHPLQDKYSHFFCFYLLYFFVGSISDYIWPLSRNLQNMWRIPFHFLLFIYSFMDSQFIMVDRLMLFIVSWCPNFWHLPSLFAGGFLFADLYMFILIILPLCCASVCIGTRKTCSYWVLDKYIIMSKPGFLGENTETRNNSCDDWS